MAVTFNYTGSAQSWVVPAGYTTITVECWGAQGGVGNQTTTAGNGGYAKGKVAVTPGETLTINVGGQPTGTNGVGGWPDGGSGAIGAGGGGGGSAVLRGSTNLLVAGGGGGAGGGTNSNGGTGGGTTGGNGTNATTAYQGGGATQTANGTNSTAQSTNGGGGGGYHIGGYGLGGGGGSGYIGGATSATMSNGVQSGNGKVVITYNSAPNAPTLTSPANNSTIDRGIVQRFAWTFSDPDAGDSQSKFDLQYRVVNTTPWTTVSGTTPNTFYDFAASTFAAGNYEWQVRTYDSQGVVGPWCSSSFFTAADAPPQPTITAPTSGATVNNTATLTWSAPNQTDYQWRRVADNAGSADTSTIYQDSGDVVDSTTRSVTVTFDTNNRYEHIQVRIKNAGLWSSWADIRVLVSYTPPTVATFTMAADPTTATRTLTITNPAPGSGVPATSYNDVYVRTAASSTVLDTYRPYSATGTRIGTQLATNTAFVDRTPAGSPVVYEYRVVSVASNGTTSDSGWVSTA